MNWEFDWLSDWRVSLNLLLNVLLGGVAGCLLAYWMSPAGTVFLSKTIMAAGFAPAVIAFVAKMQKSPAQQHSEEQTKQIRDGEIPGRRVRDPAVGPTRDA